MRIPSYFQIPLVALAGACTPFFDSTPSGRLVQDTGSDVQEDAVQDAEDDVYRIENGWQCGPYELLDPPDLGEGCTQTGVSCLGGECIVVAEGPVCTNFCAPAHCPEMCGARGACAVAGAEFADGTPQGLCAPRLGDFALCTFDEQCAGDFCFKALPVDGIRDFGWCLPTCEGSCEPVEGLESFCVPLDDEPGPGSSDVCFVGCVPSAADAGQCPADLNCIPIDADQGFCAVYPAWMRALVEDRRD